MRGMLWKVSGSHSANNTLGPTGKLPTRKPEAKSGLNCGQEIFRNLEAVKCIPVKSFRLRLCESEFQRLENYRPPPLLLLRRT